MKFYVVSFHPRLCSTNIVPIVVWETARGYDTVAGHFISNKYNMSGLLRDRVLQSIRSINMTYYLSADFFRLGRFSSGSRCGIVASAFGGNTFDPVCWSANWEIVG